MRIDFGQRLSAEQLRSVIWLLEHEDPEAQVREAASGHGLVISSRRPDQPLRDPRPRLDQVLKAPTAQLPEPPPQGLHKLARQSRQGTINILISLAIAGWALPVLPGTPFFLLAWWMGWRPKSRPQDRTTSNQGETTRAERHVS